MGSIPIIELDLSDSKKRGQAYGETAGSNIKRLREIYKELFREMISVIYKGISVS